MNKINLLYFLPAIIVLGACSKDDSVDPPAEDSVYTVIISPKEVKFEAIGQSHQLTAKAFNEEGDEVNTSFTWLSDNPEIAIISSAGIIETVGEGSTFIKVNAADKTDSALVTVEPEIPPGIWWVSKSDGDWSDGSNWNTGTVPNNEDTVAITLEGNYTVSLTSDVSVKHIIFGSDNGEQVLSTGANTFTVENGIMTEGANLQIDGSVVVTGQLDWETGDMLGDGTLEISSTGAIITDGNNVDTQFKIKTDVNNYGLFKIKDGASVLIDGKTFENKSGAEIDFQGADVSLYAVKGSIINNMGTIVKSQGDGFAYISPASEQGFVNTGTLRVERGTLNIRDGKLIGQIDIAEDAVLRQSGTTLIKGLHGYSGDGFFEIGGAAILGEQTGELVRLRNVILDAPVTGGLFGPGDLEIVNELIWYSGSMSDAGVILVNNGSETSIKGEKTKYISERQFLVLGTLETDMQLNMTLRNGAEIKIDPIATWTHIGGGKIMKGSGDTPTIDLKGTFIKKNPGSLEIEADIECYSIMYLNEGVLTAKGDFILKSLGKIVGGSTDRDSEANYRRLNLINAGSAILEGTIDVDSDGEIAFMGILGKPTLESTFKVLTDIQTNSEAPEDRLVFETGSVELNGTLEVTILGGIPPAGAQYQVVSMIDGAGQFTTISGVEVFNSVVEDDKGVLLIR